MRSERKIRQRGVVLIAVVWAVFILTAMAFALAALVRSGSEEMRAREEHLQAYYLARGAVYEAIPAVKQALVLPQGLASLSRDGQPVLEWTEAGNHVRVDVIDEAGKLDLNAAPPAVLERLFTNFGMNFTTAHNLVAAISDWRDADDDTGLGGAESSYYLTLRQPYRAANRDFHSVEELLLVRGVTPELLYGGYRLREDGAAERQLGLLDCLTVHSRSHQVNINFAPAVVLLALPGLSPMDVSYILQGRRKRLFTSVEDFTRQYPVMIGGETLGYLSAGSSGTYSLIASGTTPGGTMARLRAVVQVGGLAFRVRSGAQPPPFVIWSWDDSYVR